MSYVFEITWNSFSGEWCYDVYDGDEFIGSSEFTFESYEEAYNDAICSGYKWNGDQN